ncbi:MAG: RNA polymerase sigma factor [Cyclobacteriaceae bacterium]
MFLKVNKSVSEEELITGCKIGNSKAQRHIYEKYAGKMLGICLRYVKEEPEAEDIMIKGFTRVFEKVDQYSGMGSFEGWIRRIMVNEALGYLRRNKNMYLEVEIEKAAYEPDYRLIDNSLEAEELVNMINELPMGYRSVFNLYAIEGYSHKEIAEQMEISENTSKSQLSRARALLQKKLAEREESIKNMIGNEK